MRGYGYKIICHSAGKYTCDENGDRFFKVHFYAAEELSLYSDLGLDHISEVPKRDHPILGLL